jgi:hypothetical protein
MVVPNMRGQTPVFEVTRSYESGQEVYAFFCAASGAGACMTDFLPGWIVRASFMNPEEAESFEKELQG